MFERLIYVEILLVYAEQETTVLVYAEQETTVDSIMKAG